VSYSTLEQKRFKFTATAPEENSLISLLTNNVFIHVYSDIYPKIGRTNESVIFSSLPPPPPIFRVMLIPGTQEPLLLDETKQSTIINIFGA
jgi:hypothetical protein